MSEMKDSGIDTIGLVPESWKETRLKYLCEVQTGNEDTQNANPDGQYPFYVRSPIIEHCDRFTFDGEGILVAGDGAGAGRIFHHVYGKYAVHQRVYRLSDFKFNADFIHYYLSNLFPHEMDKGSAQSTVPSMRLPMLLNFKFFLPAIDEAKKITLFLDSKCAEIDSLVADIQSEIETLEEYKRSVITEAVTQGLSREVEMKDSGIEWIGMIPKHWKIDKIKYHLRRNELRNPGNVQVLSVYREFGVIPKESRDDNHNVTSEDTSKYKYVKPGVLVINKMKAWQGSMGVSEYEGIVSPAYFIYEFTDNVVVGKYLHYLLRNVYKDEFRRISGGIREGQWDLPAAGFESEYITIPPVKEQQDIVFYLDETIANIEEIISMKQEQLSTLEEYKKSVIYEYVTGKKEVPLS